MKLILITIIRSIAAYILLLTLGRIMGSKLISRINYFDLVISVTIGSIATRMALGTENSILLSSISLITLTLLVIITDRLDLKSLKFRKLIDSEPVLAISNGKILKENLRKNKFTLNMLLMELRMKDVFNINDVEYAIIEANGEVTVLLKSEKKAATPQEMNIQVKPAKLSIDIIIDGNILYDNLRNSGYDKKWLINQLRFQNIDDIKKVFYACIDPDGKLFVS